MSSSSHNAGGKAGWEAHVLVVAAAEGVHLLAVGGVLCAGGQVSKGGKSVVFSFIRCTASLV